MRLRRLWTYCCLCAVWTVGNCPPAASVAMPRSAKLARWHRGYGPRQQRSSDDEVWSRWADEGHADAAFRLKEEKAVSPPLPPPTEAIAGNRAPVDIRPAPKDALRLVVHHEIKLLLRHSTANADGREAAATVTPATENAVMFDAPHHRHRRRVKRSSWGGPSSQDIRDSVIPHLRQYESVLDRSTFLILWYLLSHNMHGTWEDANSLYGRTTAEPTTTEAAASGGFDATAAAGFRDDANSANSQAAVSAAGSADAAGLALSPPASLSSGGRSKLSPPGQSTAHRGACHESSCLNGGVCYVISGSAKCRCPAEFGGRRCHKRQTQEHGDAGRTSPSGQYRDYASWRGLWSDKKEVGGSKK